MPGLTRRRWMSSESHASVSWGRAGRGPTRLISPRTTFQSWGSSSIEVLRRMRPTRVTRGSCLILKSGPSASFSSSSVVELLLGVDDHRAQLEHAERLGVAPDADLAEEHRPLGVELDRDGRDQQDRRGDDQAEPGADDVERPLGARPASRAHHRLDVDDREPAERPHREPLRGDVAERRGQLDVDALVEQVAGQAVRDLAVDAARRHDHARARLLAQDAAGVGDRAEQRDAGDRVAVERAVVDEPEHVVAEPCSVWSIWPSSRPSGLAPAMTTCRSIRPWSRSCGEDPAGHLALDEHEAGDQEEEDGQGAALDQEPGERSRSARSVTTPRTDGVHDAADLVDPAADEAGVVEALVGEDEQPGGQREEGDREEACGLGVVVAEPGELDRVGRRGSPAPRPRRRRRSAGPWPG